MGVISIINGDATLNIVENSGIRYIKKQEVASIGFFENKVTIRYNKGIVEAFSDIVTDPSSANGQELATTIASYLSTSSVISGTVSIDNFPDPQNVAVNNFPASQTIDGAVDVNNFPASQNVAYTDNPSLSAFGRLRTAQEQKKLEISAIDGKQPLFMNEEIGGGVSNTSTVVDSTIRMVADNLGYVVRQSKQRAVYQKGNSQLILLTFDSFDLQFNIEKRVGYFTSSTVAPFTANRDGIFLLSDGADYSIVQAKNGTETVIGQNDWNVDTFDGSGASGVTIDFSQRNILVIDEEWLGVGRVRVGFNVGGITYIAHEFLNANNGTGVYILNGSKPIRWEVRSTNTLTSGNLTQICGSVSSEGAQNQLGKVRSVDVEDIQANSISTVYPMVGIRLQSGKDFSQIDIKRISVLAETNDDFVLYVCFNPILSGTPTFTPEVESVIESASGVGLTLSDFGTRIGILHGRGDRATAFDIPSELRLGTNIDGTRDEIWLAVKPITTNLDIWGSLTWQEQI